ncbi:MAG TPA: DUF4159 domain-containing protein [Cyanophyceae cyanobacterium]
MSKSWPPPLIKPFERLQVTDGLLMNAQRWRLAHDYHRQRQNMQYQSLNQPGIVCGLGVSVIAPPADVRPQYRDGRWVQIQPGLAIDLFGNFIVITEPENYRIVSENRTTKPLLIYLTASYVDPEKLRRKQLGEVLRETFRLDEKASPPSETEVELCRILLPPSQEDGASAVIQLENPKDVFFPTYNNIDLLYRPQARSRPQAVVRVAQVINRYTPENAVSHLPYLLQSVEVLYPAMTAIDDVPQVSLSPSAINELVGYDLLYLQAGSSLSLNDAALEALNVYLATGGVLLVDIATQGTRLGELSLVKQQLQDAIARLNLAARTPTSIAPDKQITGLGDINPELEAELKATQAELEEEIHKTCLVFSQLAQQLGTPLENLDNLIANHPIRTRPFLFSALPNINEQPIQIMVGGGIIILVGDLSSAWGLDPNRPVSRETIRTAQELGINLLHFAWRKRQLTPLPQEERLPSVTPEPEKPRSSERLRKALDTLIE